MTGNGGTPVELPPTTISLLPTTTVNTLHNKSSLYATGLVEGIETEFLADTGAEISVLPATHKAVATNRNIEPISLQPVTLDGVPLDVLGTLTLDVVINKMSLKAKFYI